MLVSVVETTLYEICTNQSSENAYKTIWSVSLILLNNSISSISFLVGNIFLAIFRYLHQRGTHQSVSRCYLNRLVGCKVTNFKLKLERKTFAKSSKLCGKVWQIFGVTWLDPFDVVYFS